MPNILNLYDGTKIPYGTSVVFVPDTENIRAATANEIPFGVISSNPSILANSSEENWHGMFERDKQGKFIVEPFEELSEIEINNDTDINKKKILSTTCYKLKLSKDYDPTKKYIARSLRDEWNPVALLGKVKILKNQPTKNNWIKLKSIDDEYDSWLIN